MSDIDLPTGQYYIRNGGNPAGLEDGSGDPNSIICPTRGDAEPWDLEKLPNGNYILKVRGVPTGELDGRLYAIPTEPAPEWTITRLENTDNAYTIENSSSNIWSAQVNVEDPQVAVIPLETTHKLPAQTYSASGLFGIERI